jgi:formylglycine-generating enzyme required for sulfatase activity/uncharacterized caspase-like protein
MAKIALLIGISEYSPEFAPLPGTATDVAAMKRVLEDGTIAAFDQVTTLLNPQKQEMEEAIFTLFNNRRKEDLILFYFSGHGVKDENGRLYLTTRITRKEMVEPTAVAASYLNARMSNSRAKQQVLILDCCFSGAFATDMTAKAPATEDIAAELRRELQPEGQPEAEGRAVLTSSSATQYAFEQPNAQLSVYTHYLIEGLSTGAADLDNDGEITIDELHDYARSRVQEAAPAMKPQIFAVREGYKIRLARAPKGDPKLQYRKAVEEAVQENHGEIDPIDRITLNVQQRELSLTAEEAGAIEAEILKPYQERRRKLQDYETAWRAAIQRGPITEAQRTKLKRLQQVLRLRDEDVAAIATAFPPPPPVEIPPPEPTQSETRSSDRPLPPATQPQPSQKTAASVPPQAPPQKPSTRIAPQVSPPTPSRQTEPVPQRLISTPDRPSKPQPQSSTSQPSAISRQQFLKWAGFGGGGLVIALVANRLFQTAPSDQSSPPPVTASAISLQPFNFESVTVNEKGEEQPRRPGQAQSFKENLGNGLELEMVSVPAGSFTMGSPENEKNREADEGPQRTVKVPTFFMGKFVVTQAQWQAIATLPKVKIDLNPDPSNFKGDNRPVEQVSWNEAVEFCDRLSRLTGRTYRLPSEAEWEYACRAGTITPFHTGETITSKLANYDGTSVYRSEPKWKFRVQTTPVGNFKVANAFGLYDMHGNVWEWCQDVYHENYQGAPVDGSAWLTGGDSSARLLRGGSWGSNPGLCRSAIRGWYDADGRRYSIGFRLALSLPGL